MTATVGLHSDCVFCRELNGSRDTNFAKRYPEIASRIVGESASLVAFPCIGQLSPGHFLVVPKSHDATFRETATRTPDLRFEFQALVRHVHSLLDVNDQDSLYFEHGAGSATDGGCGIYHAHIHVIPNAGHLDLTKHFPTTDRTQSRLVHNAWSELPQDGPYIFYGSASQTFFSHKLDSALPSQTLRRIVASELNATTWDWREANREVSMLKILGKAETCE